MSINRNDDSNLNNCESSTIWTGGELNDTNGANQFNEESKMEETKNRFFSKSVINSEESPTGGNEHCCRIDLDKTEETELPEGYEWLPAKYFPYNGIPLPLVSKLWLKSLNKKIQKSKNEILNENDSDDESDLLLSQLKIKLIENEAIATEQVLVDLKHKKGSGELVEENEKNLNHTEKVEANNLCESADSLMIKRKRGRPRKGGPELKPVENVPAQTGNQFDLDSWNGSACITNEDVSTIMKDCSKKSIDNCDLAIDMFLSRKKADNTTQESKYETEFYKKVEKIDSKISHSCFDCGKSFSALSTLKNHKRIHEGTLWECVKCRRGFTTKYLLKCHNRIHNGDLFRCQECEKGFITAELLKVHRRSHTGDRPFVCHMCTKSFSSSSNLSQHKQTHSSEREYLCFLCGSAFTQKRCLDGHMLTHSEKNHICNVCGKLWARKSDLMEHMRVHTGVKPYSCSLCPQKFTQASSLKRHQSVHLDTKPIKCSTCSKMFKCPEYYRRHIKNHTTTSHHVNDEIISQ